MKNVSFLAAKTERDVLLTCYFRKISTLFIGLDIVLKNISICFLGEISQLVCHEKVKTVEQLMRILKSQTDRFEVRYETGCGYGVCPNFLLPFAELDAVWRAISAWFFGGGGLSEPSTNSARRSRNRV